MTALARRRARRNVLAAGALAAALFATGAGVIAMASTELVWQGAAGRAPDRFMAVRIDGNEPEGGGLFGIQRSPSLAGALPDAHVLKATAIGPGAGGSTLSLRIPGGELPPLGQGDRALFGMVGEAICLCVLKPPEDVPPERFAKWAAGQPCGR